MEQGIYRRIEALTPDRRRLLALKLGFDFAADGHEMVLAVYYAVKKNAQLTDNDLRQYLMDKLPDYMLPAYLIPMDSIPLTPNGKVDRRALESLDIKGKDEKFRPPRDEIEKQLAAIWSDVLGLEKQVVSIDGNFFQLGGHSLKTTILLSRIHKTFDTKIPLALFFKFPTIEGLAGHIKKADRDTYTAIEKIPQQDYYPLSYNQKRLWIIAQLDTTSSSYNMSGIVPLAELVDEEILKQVLAWLIQRHEAFRTGFRIVEGEVFQYVVQEVKADFKVMDISDLEEPGKRQKRREVFSRIAAAPFDLAKAPLFRALLLKMENRYYELIFAMHHIISDGWSMEILTRDFSRIYDALRQGKEVEIEPLQIQYKDFAVWHNKHLEDPPFKEKAHKFWLEKLAGGVPPLELPKDFSGTPRGKESAGYECIVSGQVEERLKQLAKTTNSSLFTLLFTLVNMLLARLSCRQDVVCGIPAAGREHLLLQDVVGFFVNTLVLKNQVDYELNFRQFLENINNNFREALQYQDYPLELALDDLGINFPDIKVFFNMNNMSTTPVERYLEDSGDSHLEKVNDTKFELVLNISEYNNGIKIQCLYRKELFDKKRIEFMIKQYKELLDMVSLDPGRKLKEYLFKKKQKKIKI